MNAQMMEWNDLQLVLAVCRKGTLSGAARELGVNHSTVFRRVASIEEKLGVRLFERHSRGYVMTEAGELVYASAQNVDNEVLNLSRKLIGRDLQLTGTLRVAVPDALLLKVLMKHFTEFTGRYPGIELELIMSNNYLNLTRREADVAIRVTNSPPETAIGKYICSMQTTIYASSEYIRKQPSRDIGEYSWLMPDESLSQLPVTKWFSSRYPQARVALRCNSLMGLYEAVAQKMGIASLPCFLADKDSQLERLLLPPKELSAQVWLLTHPDLRRTARVQVLMQFLESALIDEKNLLEGVLVN